MIERELRALLEEALVSARRAGDLSGADLPEIEISRPRQKEHGDWATNIALALQKSEGKPPRQIAEVLVRNLPARDWVRSAEIAGPGFINFRLSGAWLHEACVRALREGPEFAASDEGGGGSVNVEFVSINPTGPLHVAHGRHAAVGDAIARLLDVTGHVVTREYYFNDAGGQMDLFGQSVAARYLRLAGRDVSFPDDGYQGDYVTELARELREEDGGRHDDEELASLTGIMRERAYERVLGWIQDTLERFGVRFDVWFKESALYRSGKVDEVLQTLRQRGAVYDRDGAVWVRTSDFGDGADRVGVKSDGGFTYRMGDLAYHLDKVERGFDRMVILLGADHHGHVQTLLAGMRALGRDADRIEPVIMQFVHLLRGGEAVPMGKRTGSFVTLSELIDEVGVDAARYTFLQASVDHDVDFDIEEVKKQTLENPVYYVQYAHARIASIIRHAAERGTAQPAPDEVVWEELSHESELALMGAIASFPEIVGVAARQRAPYRLTKYAEELARYFHRFYTDCRVVTEDEALTRARLALCGATKQVLGDALGLLGVSAPERMERSEDVTENA